MLKTYCDVCKKEIGVEVSIPGHMYNVVPCDNGFYQTFGLDKHKHVCAECSNRIRKAIQDEVDAIVAGG